ncbi:hypothetical protein [Tardiphaga sp.]|uniref:hypothetical protein n=1 Tax=Tardiphaga sp. TaxID=1926292 RepID=UPI00260260FF|nr:hypothetical protein [Tardiphaga sp.]
MEVSSDIFWPPAMVSVSPPLLTEWHFGAMGQRKPGALENRLRTSQSFHEKTRQFPFNWNQKGRPKAPFEFDICRIRGKFERSD